MFRDCIPTVISNVRKQIVLHVRNNALPKRSPAMAFLTLSDEKQWDAALTVEEEACGGSDSEGCRWLVTAAAHTGTLPFS